MSLSNDNTVSRRKLLGYAAAAGIGSGLIGLQSAHAQGEHKAGGDKNAGTRTYNVRDFGAKGDGNTLDTTAFQKAIDTCNHDMGGTVLVPAGNYIIGTVQLKSNVRLHLAASAQITGSADGKQYYAAEAIPLRGDSTLGDGHVGLIFAVEAENITIDGNGTIDGQGEQFRSPERGVPPPSGRGGAERPYHLLFYHCKNLSVRDIFLKASAFHSIRVVQCSYAKFEGLRIYNRVNHNNDGFHFISCEHVHVDNCDVQSQDDACALFGSCKWVTVTNSTFSTRWSVFRFGGGIAENIAVSNCVINDTYGCPIKMRCGPGSRFENMIFSNILMSNVTGPISISIGPGFRRQGSPQSEEQQTPGIVRNITFSGIHGTVVVPQPLPDVTFVSRYNPGEIKSCIGLNAVEGTLERITLNDVHLVFPGGGTAEEAAVRDVPKTVGEYYAAGVFPSYALYARNARGLSLQNVRFEVASAEARPAIVFDHVDDASVNGLAVQGTKDEESVLRFISTQDVLLSSARLLTPATAFLHAEGSETSGILLDGGDMTKASKAVTGPSAAAVKVRA